MPKNGKAAPPTDTALAELVDAWNRLRPADALERRVAEDDDHGPENLIRLVRALDQSARRTGGTLVHATDQLPGAETGAGALHHLLELLHHSGASAAVSAARALDAPTRGRILAVLRAFWQTPMKSLGRPLNDASSAFRRAPWRS
ncbi:hypothetical protein RM572_25490 [Streptomyces sp. DSM 42041]|uniref:Uncharacterized protein n=1 Tax=Streptomyces hazeniae TaxID=3075538 RepID=A0ABU2NYR2_9ACTN|nr:hypothetical protein [Streptomyces sp. DSM 42041]MDT0382119.1 hypothetical protein [Streptomyces sp. DSM 42041]